MILASLSVCATRKGKVAAMGGDEAEEKSPFSGLVVMLPRPPFCLLMFGGRGFAL